jgi:predicted GNAT family acetyltransferase
MANFTVSLVNMNAIVRELEEAVTQQVCDPIVSVRLLDPEAKSIVAKRQGENFQSLMSRGSNLNLLAKMKTHRDETYAAISGLMNERDAAQLWIDQANDLLDYCARDLTSTIPSLSDIDQAMSLTLQFASLSKDQVDSLKEKIKEGLKELVDIDRRIKVAEKTDQAIIELTETDCIQLSYVCPAYHAVVMGSPAKAA